MYKYIKRFLDIITASIAVIVLSPLMIITAIAVRLESEGPALFLQDRIGLGGNVFKIYKFRSMCQGAEHIGTGCGAVCDNNEEALYNAIKQALTNKPCLQDIKKQNKEVNKFHRHITLKCLMI